MKFVNMSDGVDRIPMITVLIAEDNVDEALFLTRSLRKHADIKASIVANGEEAITYLEGKGKFSDRNLFPFPGFIWIDLKMPRKGGFDVLLWIKDHPHCAAVPCIVWSSSKQPEDVERAYRLGANTYFCKPVSLQEWDSLIADIVRYWCRSEKPQRTGCENAFSPSPEIGPP